MQLLAATSSDAAATADAVAYAVATQDPALLSPPLSSSGSQVGTWTRTTSEPTEGATVAPAQHLTAIASQEEGKEEPSGAKASQLLDHRSVREVNEKSIQM